MWRKSSWCLVIVLFFLVLPFVSANVVINEILANPKDGCNDCTEYVELFSDTEADLTNYILNFGGKNNTLSCSIDDYLIFTKNKTKFLEKWSVEGSKVMEVKGSLHNKDGDTVRLHDDANKLLDNMSYSTSKEEKSWSYCEEWIEESPTPLSENDCDEEEPEEEDEPEEGQEDSEITITKSPSIAEFGEIIYVELEIYRGDTGKYAVYAYVSNKTKEVSEKTVFHARNKFTDYEIKLPIAIEKNCNNKYSEGEYMVIIEGLGEKDSKKIILEEGECKEKIIEKEKVINTSQLPVINKITGKAVAYSDSKIEKTKWLLLITSLIIILALIMKKLE